MKALRSLFTLPAISVFLLALLVRFVYNETVTIGYYPLHDSLTYQTIALNMLHEHCYCFLPHLSTVDRAPLWPGVIAVIYGLVGERDHLVRFFLCVVGSGTCLLVYFFAKDLFGSRVGLLAGLAAAVYPFLYIYDGWLYSESLYIFLLFAFCYALFRLQRTPRWPLMLISGVLLGLLSLTRPNGIAILGLFVVWVLVLAWARVLAWRKAFQSMVVITLVSMIFVVPWTIRNYAVAHTFISIATGDGKVLVGAYNNKTVDPNFQNGYYFATWLRPEESTPELVRQFPAQCAAHCEVVRDGAYREAAIQWIQQHMSKMPMLIALHAANMWRLTSEEADLPINRFPDRTTSKLVVAMMEIITPLVFALAALGLIVTWKRWRELLFIYFMIAITIAECIVFYGISRFRAPIEPMLLVLAAGAVWWLITIFNRQRKAHA
jgi:4-amino-4-deoxy-L-arabinose transferase-like glycosyltransferase